MKYDFAVSAPDKLMSESTTSGVPDSGKVTILLSTFNGSKFLQQQLDSLYGQTYPNIRILVRDDGSSDTTRAILESERAKGRIKILEGHGNLGPTLSFFELLKSAASTETEYVAFCDQDDVWLPDKISRAVAKLMVVTDDRPAMYCSRLEIVDENLGHVGFTVLPGKVGFGNALVESVAVGCTVVLNRKAIDLLCANLPAKAVVHDWWCYLVVSCFGDILFDEAATLMYRQHGGNAIGVAPNRLARLLRRYKRFFGSGGGHRWISGQALLLRDIYQDDIPLLNRQILNNFFEARSSWYHRLRLALSSDVWRQKRLDNLILRLLILINRV
jgi:glycosyltransferase involved in cell wall biosynthesis